jgi:MurNAc alpha-1-phosphate uridylyltransferase
MKAMILAAGLGQRMGALTKTTPKPLLKIGEQALIVHHIARLAAAGIHEIVINTARHGEQFPSVLGDGSRFGVNIVYNSEGDTPLGTAGGIFKALPLLGDAPFIVLNADVWTSYAFERLAQLLPRHSDLAHLVLVPNPPHHLGGDFLLSATRVSSGAGARHTYSGIGVYRPSLFSELSADLTAAPSELAPLLSAAADESRLSGELYLGDWLDVGTPERLNEAERYYHEGLAKGH